MAIIPRLATAGGPFGGPETVSASLIPAARGQRPPDAIPPGISAPHPMQRPVSSMGKVRVAIPPERRPALGHGLTDTRWIRYMCLGEDTAASSASHGAGSDTGSRLRCPQARRRSHRSPYATARRTVGAAGRLRPAPPPPTGQAERQSLDQDQPIVVANQVLSKTVEDRFLAAPAELLPQGGGHPVKHAQGPSLNGTRLPACGHQAAPGGIVPPRLPARGAGAP